MLSISVKLSSTSALAGSQPHFISSAKPLIQKHSALRTTFARISLAGHGDKGSHKFLIFRTSVQASGQSDMFPSSSKVSLASSNSTSDALLGSEAFWGIFVSFHPWAASIQSLCSTYLLGVRVPVFLKVSGWDVTVVG